MAEVKIQEGESIESALRRFKRKVQQEDIIKDIKKHSFYLKPGDKRRAKQALARKRNRKKIRRESEWKFSAEQLDRPQPRNSARCRSSCSKIRCNASRSSNGSPGAVARKTWLGSVPA